MQSAALALAALRAAPFVGGRHAAESCSPGTGPVALRRRPAGDRAVLWQVQAHVRVTELREVADARAYRVRELRHRQTDRVSGLARGRRREVHAMSEQRIELLADLAIDPLGIGLPARHRLQSGRPLQRHRLGEATVEHQRRLVDLQRHRNALGLGDHVLLARERRVQHADQQLHQHRRVAGTHRAESSLDDEHLTLCDHAIEVDGQRAVEQHALDRGRVQQARQLVDGRVELRRSSCCASPPAGQSARR